MLRQAKLRTIHGHVVHQLRELLFCDVLAETSDDLRVMDSTISKPPIPVSYTHLTLPTNREV